MSRKAEQRVKKTKSEVAILFLVQFLIFVPSATFFVFHSQPIGILVAILNLAALLFFSYLVIRHVTLYKTRSIVMFLLLIMVELLLVFALLYSWMNWVDHRAFQSAGELSGLDFIAYSVSHFTATGQADIESSTAIIKVITTVEMIFGYLLSAFFVASVVGYFFARSKVSEQSTERMFTGKEADSPE